MLVSSLNGGQGLGTLGYMKLTDSDGNSVNVNLSGAVTLQDVINDINSQAATANVGITAEVNSAGDGIQLVDNAGGTGSLTAANSDSGDDGGSDGTNTAVKLGFATSSGPGSSSTGTLDGGDLHLQVVSQNTLLSSYSGGAGVATGSFQITNSAGAATTIQITSGMTTIGDVINAINRSTTGVVASINSTGDGIVLEDTAGGSGTLSVTDGDSGTVQALGLTAAETTVNGTQTINGTTTHTITLQATDTLTDLENDINNLGAGLSAGIITDSSSKPYRLSLTATQSGQAGNMVVDTSGIAGMSMQELTEGRDAVLALGGGSTSGKSNAPVLVTSSSNNFTNVLQGVTLQVTGTASQPISVTVGNDGTNIADGLAKLRDELQQFPQSAHDRHGLQHHDGNRRGALGRPRGLATRRATGTNGDHPVCFQRPRGGSLADVGITVNSDGSLNF